MVNQTFNKIKNCTVLITAQTNFQEMPFMSGEYIEQNGIILSKGTGFICSKDGLIITAYHVVRDVAGKINVERIQGDKKIVYPAILISQHEESDTALIKIEEENLEFVDFDNYDSVEEGEDIGFIGFPLIFNIPIIHKGIIAAKTQTLFSPENNPIDIFIINSFVNPGNSGGPLFRLSNGQVIGIINSRLSSNACREQEFMNLPENYNAMVLIGGVDPIKLAVDTYNKNLAYIGEVAQLGIGISASAKYAKNLIRKYLHPNNKNDTTNTN